MNSQTVILADDHALFRAGMCSLIDDMAGYEVIAQAQNGDEAVGLVTQHLPDLVVLDISMPGLNGIEALPQIKQASPDTRVLMVSMYGTADFVMQTLRAGADGFLLKDAAAVELQFALCSISLGRHYLSPAVSSAVVDEALAPHPRQAASPLPTPARADIPLTARQSEILELLVTGYSIKEIAHQLDISAKTVEAHRAQILKRLDVRNVPQLVLYAVRHGLITANSPGT